MSDELKYYSFKEHELKTVIEKDFEFVGQAYFEHPILIKGKMEGEIKSKSDVYINKNAIVDCHLDAMVVNIRGNFKGDIISRERLEILKGSNIKADVECNDIIIQSNSIFNGNCKMPVSQQ